MNTPIESKNLLGQDPIQADGETLDIDKLRLDLTSSLWSFMQSLKRSGSWSFVNCATGQTSAGKQVTLGFSCFALKMYYMLGWWDKLSLVEKDDWIQHLNSFQSNNKMPKTKLLVQNSFFDIKLCEYLTQTIPIYQRWWTQWVKPLELTPMDRVVIAETKQAIATLAQVGKQSNQAYEGYPKTTADLEVYLNRLDWTKPWGAGGQASALAVFYQTEAPRVLGIESALELREYLRTFFESLADPDTGGYFKGSRPAFGQLINGAMKVLTGLDWLNAKIIYPALLIDSALSEFPESEGCHVVDWIYVIYRSRLQIRHREPEIQQRLRQMLPLILRHANKDGGFSSRIGRSKSLYYGVKVSKGYCESDIHGTVLLTWALAMIFEMLGHPTWNVIRP